MKKWHAKSISNLLKLGIVIFIFFNYMYQSRIAGHPLTSDEAKSLLYVAMASFLILCPIDASIFIKNWKGLTGGNNDKKEGEHDSVDGN